MFKQRSIFLLAVFLAQAVGLLLFADTGRTATVFEKLVMPGALIEGHAKLEEQCDNCHKAFDQSSQIDLCLACHKTVARDLRSGLGFHGRRSDVKGTECKHCHTDHKGRGEDIVGLDMDTFNHDLTDFALTGGHARVVCEGCHKAGKKHREAPGQCIDCHRSDDPHQQRLGTACANCHGTESWAQTRFNHDKTNFPLIGAHKKVDCQSCHAGERYKETPKACIGCHQTKDVHQGRYGKKCESCHQPKAWRDIAFDHDRRTDFPLTGRHRKVRCDSCHTGDLFKQDLGEKCVDCHRNDDPHKGRNGAKCETCHGTNAWQKTAFDHNKNTKFPLKGRHAKLQCEDCHKGNVSDEKQRNTCFACHQLDDVHKSQEGQTCDTCHNEDGWQTRVFFDHDLTRFPLIGLHAPVPCEECHLASTFKDTDLACVGCHSDDDVHKRQLGPGCQLCHNPNGWALWRFDHETQTGFSLDGAHAELVCKNCHKAPGGRYVSLSKACNACHRKDDPHRGRFGRACERCHSTDSFKKVKRTP